MTTQTDVQAVIDFAAKHLGTEKVVIEHDGVKVPGLILPSGRTFQSLVSAIDGQREHPVRKEGSATLRTLDSFIAHVNRFKNPHSAIFAAPDAQSPRLTAVLDYHEAQDGKPRFGAHRSVLDLELSEAWKAWTGKNGQQMDVSSFAEFLESRVEDVVDSDGLDAKGPTMLLAEKLSVSFAKPAMMMAVARGLHVKATTNVSDVVNLETGEVNLKFEVNHEPAGGLRAPAAFVIGIQVFRGGQPYYVAVRLRYRLANGKVYWTFHLYRTDKVFDLAFEESCTKAQTETKLPLMFGADEDDDTDGSAPDDDDDDENE